MIPEPEHLDASLIHECRTVFIIVGVMRVLSTVQLDDKSSFMTIEVCDEGSEAALTVEFQSHESPRSEEIPKFLFGICLVSAQSPAPFQR